MSAVGLDELICVSAETYEQQVVALEKDPHWLCVLQAKLTQAGTEASLFQSAQFVKHLEQALRKLWLQHIDK